MQRSAVSGSATTYLPTFWLPSYHPCYALNTSSPPSYCPLIYSLAAPSVPMQRAAARGAPLTLDHSLTSTPHDLSPP
eukprot:8315760-Pyramimonas_sp.AAC.1